MDYDETSIGPVPEKYLNLRPHDTYDENIDAIDAIIDGEYDVIGETAEDLHPRVFHSAFSQFYNQKSDSAKVDAEAMKQMQDILSENSEKDHYWLEDKLFKLGYSLGPKPGSRSPSSRRRGRKNPDLPYGRDMIPDFGPGILENPVRKGRKKREGDEHYQMSNMRMFPELADMDLEVI